MATPSLKKCGVNVIGIKSWNEIKRIAMEEPSGKYNVCNKIRRSEETSNEQGKYGETVSFLIIPTERESLFPYPE